MDDCRSWGNHHPQVEPDRCHQSYPGGLGVPRCSFWGNNDPRIEHDRCRKINNSSRRPPLRSPQNLSRSSGCALPCTVWTVIARGEDGGRAWAPDGADSRILSPVRIAQLLDAEEPEIAAALAAARYDLAMRLIDRAYRTPLHRYCLRLLDADEELALEALQETLASVWQELGGFRGQSKLRQWIYRIAHHRCVDEARKRRRRRPAAGPLAELDDDLAGGPEVATDEAADRRRRHRALRACLAGLDDGSRSLVLLRYEAGLGWEELAAVARRSRRAAERRLLSAMSQLGRCLRRKGVEAADAL